VSPQVVRRRATIVNRVWNGGRCVSRGLDAYVCVGVVWRVFVRAGLRTFYFRIALCLVKHLFRDSVYSECYS
jgi:hypothetical protein